MRTPTHLNQLGAAQSVVEVQRGCDLHERKHALLDGVEVGLFLMFLGVDPLS
jgi:hypothetical protein